MLIRLKKTADGVVLTCVRDDGSAAIQRTRYGGFFAFHDLMHYSVETVLGLDLAFLGLVASGWEFETFGDKDDPRYRSMPRQALFAERVVNILARHHRPGVWRDPELLPVLAEDVHRDLAAESSPEPAPALSPAQVAQIFARFEAVTSAWADVPMGGHLELLFPAPPPFGVTGVSW